MTNNDILKMDNIQLEKLIRNTFPINLDKILNSKNILLKDLLDGIKMSNSSKWAYKTNNTFPSIGTLIKISIFLDVSINDLLLPEEINNSIRLHQAKKDVMEANVKKILLIVENIEKEINKK